MSLGGSFCVWVLQVRLVVPDIHAVIDRAIASTATQKGLSSAYCPQEETCSSQWQEGCQESSHAPQASFVAAEGTDLVFIDGVQA